MRSICVLSLAGFIAASCVACSSSKSSAAPSSPLCTGSGRCVPFTPSSTESDISAAFAGAKDGDTIAFGPGTYEFNNQLALGTASNVTVVGSGQGQTILDFHGQVAGEDSIFAQGGDAGIVGGLVFEAFTVKDSPGNAIKTLGVTGVTFDHLTVTWTAMNKTDGAYGLYPVQSTNVLIQNCVVSGAADSGVYVGQSQQIVVRNNEVFGNVAGIEIENSFFADVYENNAHDNTGGILVFDLPNLQQEGGHSIRVFSNLIRHNNTANFAVNGDIVGLVPAGTGFFVMANHDVEVFSNTIEDNNTGNAGILSYKITLMTYSDPHYYPYPRNIHVHDNTYIGGGTMPDPTSALAGLISGGMSAYPGGHAPDVTWDGVVDPAVAGTGDAGAGDASVGDGGVAGPNPMMICIDEKSSCPGSCVDSTTAQCSQCTSVCDTHLDTLLAQTSTTEAMLVNCDPTPFTCSLPPLPPVSFAGLTPPPDAGPPGTDL